MSEVYRSTTEADRRAEKAFMVPSNLLSAPRFGVKAAEVLLSFVAFVLEEVVTNCLTCGALYFFEFISCTAFLFTLLLLVLLATKLNKRVGITCWPKLDFIYTTLIAVLFLSACIAFAVANSGTSLEHTAMAFGFLATAAFVADLVLFYKKHGNPWSPSGPEAETTPNPPVPEAAALNAQPN